MPSRSPPSPLFALALVLAVALVTSTSMAQTTETTEATPRPFGERHRTIFSIENVGGFLHVQERLPDQSLSSGVNHFGTFVVAPTSRVGIHRVVGKGFTLGTGFTLGDFTDHGTNASLTIWALAPRVGYVAPLGTHASLWLRGGLTYFHASARSADYWQVAPAAEVFLVLTPFDHFGVMLGLVAEVGVAGKRELPGSYPSMSASEYRYSTYGLSLGFLFDL